MAKILILGAGNVSTRLARRLIEEKQHVIAGVRNPDKISDLVSLGVEARTFDFEKKETYETAIKDVDAIFLTTIQNQFGWTKAVVDAAKSSGVKLIVRLSGLACFVGHKFAEGHQEADDYVRKCELKHTIIAPNFFTSNILRHAATIKHGFFNGAAGDGKTAYIHPDDIAEVSLHALLHSDKYNGKTLDLSGDRAYTEYEIAALFSGVLGREITYNNYAKDGFVAELKKNGVSEFFSDFLAWLETIKQSGKCSEATKIVEEVTGKKARSFLSFILDNKAAFMPDPPKPTEKRKLGFIPGTGRMGATLAENYAKLGHEVFIGSREAKKGEAAFEALKKVVSDAKGEGGTSKDVAAKADIIFWGISGSLSEREAELKSIASELKGKIVVDLTNICYLAEYKDEKNWGQFSSLELNMKLVPEAKWVTGWKLIYSQALRDPAPGGIKRDVQVNGDDATAKSTVIDLINQTGFRGFDGGSAKEARLWEYLLVFAMNGVFSKAVKPGAFGSFRFF